nr:MAG TPA: hypothetical protein [Caudoviricetes sp.]
MRPMRRERFARQRLNTGQRIFLRSEILMEMWSVKKKQEKR